MSQPKALIEPKKTIKKEIEVAEEKVVVVEKNIEVGTEENQIKEDQVIKTPTIEESIEESTKVISKPQKKIFKKSYKD